MLTALTGRNTRNAATCPIWPFVSPDMSISLVQRFSTARGQLGEQFERVSWTLKDWGLHVRSCTLNQGCCPVDVTLNLKPNTLNPNLEALNPNP